MLIDGKEIFKSKRAINGDKIALSEMADLLADRENWNESCKYLEKLVENYPEECERIFFNTTKTKLTYENMLVLIAWNYYHDQDNEPMAFRWFQKYFDYLDFKHSKLSPGKREKKKSKSPMYAYMKEQGLLNDNSLRFWLKWEHEHFIKSGR